MTIIIKLTVYQYIEDDKKLTVYKHKVDDDSHKAEREAGDGSDTAGYCGVVDGDGWSEVSVMSHYLLNTLS